MQKKIIPVILVSMLLLGCTQQPEATPTATQQPTASSTPTPEPAAVSTLMPTQTATPTATLDPTPTQEPVVEQTATPAAPTPETGGYARLVELKERMESKLGELYGAVSPNHPEVELLPRKSDYTGRAVEYGVSMEYYEDFQGTYSTTKKVVKYDVSIAKAGASEAERFRREKNADGKTYYEDVYSDYTLRVDWINASGGFYCDAKDYRITAYFDDKPYELFPINQSTTDSLGYLLPKMADVCD